MAAFESAGSSEFAAYSLPPDGECMSADIDPDLFLPRQEGELKYGFEKRVYLAKQLCRECSETVVCLTQTLEYESQGINRREASEALGIRAGTTDEERRLFRRKH